MSDNKPLGVAAQRIDHIGVMVKDADVARHLFVSRFGMRETDDWTEPNGKFRLVYLNSGDTTLQLVQPMTGPLMDELTQNGEGLHHICFQVRDLDETIETLRAGANGAPYIGGRGSRVCFLTERHHGVLIELTEGA